MNQSEKNQRAIEGAERSVRYIFVLIAGFSIIQPFLPTVSELEKLIKDILTPRTAQHQIQRASTLSLERYLGLNGRLYDTRENSVSCYNSEKSK